MTTQQFHNPECLLPDQYQSRDGWRLLLKTELRAIPFDSQVKSGGVWSGSDCQGYAGDEDCTYRTRAPLPVEDRWVKTREEDHKAFSEQYAKLRTGDNYRTMWDAAIAYERAKFRALVDRYNNDELKAHEFIHAVGEMCK